jgi:hypothetical protein
VVRSERRVGRDDGPVPVDSEVVIRLNAPADLFRVVETDLLTENGRLVSGMEELVHELLPRRLRSGGRVVVVLPVDQVGAAPGTTSGARCSATAGSASGRSTSHSASSDAR